MSDARHLRVLLHHGWVLHAYIDESGQRGHSPKASKHFILGAVVFRERNREHLGPVLAQLRLDLGMQSEAYMTWKNVRTHPKRIRIAQTIGAASWLKTVAVVACKHALDPSGMDETKLYLYQLRYLLERLSWLGRDHGEVVSYTLAHIKRLKIQDLREYENRLRRMDTAIDWAHLDPKGGAIDQPQRLESLQLADLAVSATAAAFEPDEWGNTEDRYLREFAERIYCRANRSVTSYGLKMHPWSGDTKAAHPWVAAL